MSPEILMVRRGADVDGYPCGRHAGCAVCGRACVNSCGRALNLAYQCAIGERPSRLPSMPAFLLMGEWETFISFPRNAVGDE